VVPFGGDAARGRLKIQVPAIGVLCRRPTGPPIRKLRKKSQNPQYSSEAKVACPTPCPKGLPGLYGSRVKPGKRREVRTECSGASLRPFGERKAPPTYLGYSEAARGASDSPDGRMARRTAVPGTWAPKGVFLRERGSATGRVVSFHGGLHSPRV
jgi:hypothetical protein